MHTPATAMTAITTNSMRVYESKSGIAGGAADVAPVHDRGVHDEDHRDCGDRKEDAAQPQGEKAGAETEQPACAGGGEDLHAKRRARRLKQHHRRVGADAEERRGAEVHVTGIAAENVPGGG